jgi:hypothetical protein
MCAEQAKRLKGPEKEIAWLKQLVADLSLDNAILKEAAARGKEVAATAGEKLHARFEKEKAEEPS